MAGGPFISLPGMGMPQLPRSSWQRARRWRLRMRKAGGPFISLLGMGMPQLWRC